MSESYTFTSDISSLLGLIVNSFYSSRDCFLRELISNGSDAIDKIRHESLVAPEKNVLAAEPELRIRIIADEAAKTLTIWDTGIGMTKADLISNLSCIAHSGTKEFLEMAARAQADDVNLIGQFGVGFFSAYLVADTVDVITKHNDDECLKWSSTAQGGFTIEPYTDEELKRGSKVVLHMKEDQLEYLKPEKIRELVTKHSGFVQWPIELFTMKTVSEEVPLEEGEEAEKKSDEEVEEVEEENAEEKPKTKTVTHEEPSWDRLNKQEAIWVRRPEDITEQEYNEFYRSISNDYQDALAWKHVHFEGAVTFDTIIYVPKAAPFSMFQQERKRRNIKLYVRRVFITDDCEELIPEWLSFVRGVVDANDLPLNISREMLQKHRVLKTIGKQLVKQSLELFQQIAEDEEKFKTFYEAFGQQVKLGVHECSDDETTRQRLAKLLRYYSSRATESMTSLEDYVNAMREGQKNIYYLTGESRAAIEKSPFIEGLTKRGFEVLFLTEPIDEYCFNSLREFKVGDKSYKLVCASKEDIELDLTDEEKAELEKKKERLEPLVKFMKETLGDQVEKVEVSTRVVNSPCVISTSQYGWSASMERVIRSQALADTTMLKYMSSKKILEVNPDHPIVLKLVERFEADKSDPTVLQTIALLFDTCLLVSGFSIAKPVDYADRIYRIMSAGLGVAEMLPAEQAAAPAEQAANEEAGELSDLDVD